MFKWWKVRFDGTDTGLFGYLKLTSDLTAIALYYEDGTVVNTAVDYTTIETDIDAPIWAE